VWLQTERKEVMDSDTAFRERYSLVIVTVLVFGLVAYGVASAVLPMFRVSVLLP